MSGIKYWRFALGWIVVLILGETTDMQTGLEHLFMLGLFALLDVCEFLFDNLQISLFGKEDDRGRY